MKNEINLLISAQSGLRGAKDLRKFNLANQLIDR
jgi:hypothetical protein